MKSRIPVLVALLVILVAAAGAGAGGWLLARDSGPQRPEISVYSHGHLSRVGPYQYCDVLNLNDCQDPKTLGELPVNSRDPVQLSVPSAIGRAPWLLTLVYEDDAVTAQFEAGSRLAVTIATINPHLGRLQGLAVQLPTLVRMPDDELVPVPHAEWSVQTTWG